MVYVDPPFNTGRSQRLGVHSFDDSFDDLPGYLEPRLIEIRRLLADHGTLYVHLDPREAHYVKVMLDGLFGARVLPQRDHLGIRLRRPHQAPLARQARHDPRLRQGSAGATTSTPPRSIASRTWRPGSSATRSGRGPASSRPASGGTRSCRPTRASGPAIRRRSRPAIVRRMVAASSRPGGWCLDCFAGSGTLGAVASELGRRFVLVDSNPDAIDVARARSGAAGRYDARNVSVPTRHWPGPAGSA